MGIVFILVVTGFIGFLNIGTEKVQGTDVSGIILPPGETWDLAGSPYIVVGDLTVASGANLTIEPGVEVKFHDFFGLYIDGNLSAVGTEINRINFLSNKSSPNPWDWNRLEVSSTGYLELRYANISHCRNGVRLVGTDNNNISNNIITDNWDYSLYLSSSNYNNIIDNEISSNDKVGLFLSTSSNNTIDNNTLSSNSNGIFLSGSNYNDLTNNNASWNANTGIRLSSSKNNNISNNYIYRNQNYGIYFQSTCNENLIFENDVLSNYWSGISIWISSHNNTILKNNVSSNDWSQIRIDASSGYTISNNNISNGGSNGIQMTSSSDNEITNNKIISNDGWGISFGGGQNNTLENNNISLNTDRGVVLSSTTNNSVVNNDIVGNLKGVFILLASNNTIFRNNISYHENGIEITQSTFNNILKNNISNNNITSGFNYVISMVASNNNNIANNTLLNNDWGLYLSLSLYNTITNNNISLNNGTGLWLSSSVNNSISENVISLNEEDGILLMASSDNNTIINNDISLNKNYGFFVESSSNNSIYHNSIITNTNQAYDNTNNNTWNQTYPTGGNYWSDYSGIDNFKGPNQDIIGTDGIGDTNYSIDSDSKDWYPLIEPFPGRSIFLSAGWNLISIPTIQSDNSLSSVLLSIQGEYDAVQSYNSTDLMDSWKHYHTLKPSSMNDLGEITHEIGFWIHIINPEGTIFRYNGIDPAQNQSITLRVGWNLVGFPSKASYNRSAGLNNITYGFDVNAIQWYDTSENTWYEMGEDDAFEPGRGYWIHSLVEKDWDVPL